jgi:hypothetical protein
VSYLISHLPHKTSTEIQFRFGFDSLLTVDQISISPYFPMGISLDPLENVTDVTLKGNVTL